MARVKLLVTVAGPGWVLGPGDIYECDEAEAGRMVASRFAVPVVEERIETATAAPIVETRKKKKG